MLIGAELEAKQQGLEPVFIWDAGMVGGLMCLAAALTQGLVSSCGSSISFLLTLSCWPFSCSSTLCSLFLQSMSTCCPFPGRLLFLLYLVRFILRSCLSDIHLGPFPMILLLLFCNILLSVIVCVWPYSYSIMFWLYTLLFHGSLSS